MNLKTYIKQQGYGFGVRLAKQLKIHPVYLSSLTNKRKPSPDLALKIERATNGEVTVLELLFPEKQS